ncbi:MAG: alpha/beta fold hydrolase, partial [Gammaproteobacteria bacterium]
MAPGLDASKLQGVTRHFVTIGDRQVHYLRAGTGPCVVLVHGSPESGFSLLPLIHVLKDRFTVIAPDTPGNGNSEPLSMDQPLIPDYAKALGDFLDALGIETCALFGFHTGADISVCYSTQAPARVSMVIANGFPLFTEEEVAEILDGYLPENPLRWDGSHLTWLWARFVEQLIFFP